MPMKSKLRQTAVYWAPTDEVNEHNKKVFSDPVEIKCRWEDLTQDFLDLAGNTAKSRSMVYVDREVELLGVLMLGRLCDVTDPTDPTNNENAWEIRNVQNIPNLRNTWIQRLAIL